MPLLLLVACVTEDNFARNVAAVSCSRESECYKATFEDRYDDQAECVDEQSDVLDDVVDCYLDECDFDHAAAREYLKDLHDAECDDYDAAYGDVGDVFDDCGDEWQIAACLAGVYF